MLLMILRGFIQAKAMNLVLLLIVHPALHCRIFRRRQLHPQVIFRLVLSRNYKYTVVKKIIKLKKLKSILS